MVSSDEVQLVERVNGFTAWLESVRKERGVEEARRAAVRSWIDHNLSAGRAIDADVLGQALADSGLNLSDLFTREA